MSTERGVRRVMHLCAPGEVGGLERVVELLARGMSAKGVEVHVVAVLGPAIPLPAWLEGLRANDVAVHHVSVGGRQIWREARAVDRLLREVRPDVVHTHGYRSDLLHGRRVRRHGALSATTLHGSSRMGGASHLFEWVQGWALARFDVVVAVSEPLRDELVARGVPPSRIALIPNGWSPPGGLLERGDARTELGVDRDDPILGWVGRLIPIKGCDVFLEALAHLSHRPWTALVVGDGPEAASLRERVRGVGLGDRVRFLGSVPEAARLHAGFDIFVLSSRSEGTPMVLLEALGAGVPVVATRVGGVAAALGPEAGRWLVPPENPPALAGALNAVLDALDPSDPGNEELARAVHAGRKRARDDFGVGPWVDAHLDAYAAARTGRIRRWDRQRATTS